VLKTQQMTRDWAQCWILDFCQIEEMLFTASQKQPKSSSCFPEVVNHPPVGPPSVMGNGDGDGDGGEKTVHACANACSRQRHPSWDH
jgi:hypothetical protein